MLIKVASNERLGKTFGPIGARFILEWPHGTEIRWREERVLFFDETGNWMVGFTFGDIIAHAFYGTPKSFEDEVKRWLRKVKRGDSIPQRIGHLW